MTTEGKGSTKSRLLKKAIKAVAEERGFSDKQYYKITTEEIWEKCIDLGYDRYLVKEQIPRLKLKLPKGYRKRYW